ncbi:hypothetical protein AB0F72_39660 [Actinoplanes sp. NPDC023936]|uniref:hypothetical protein n=1 Tax=Actinoplanes sp. NPDC023936 TaxID=3154910 RepID=UPI0033FB607E
MAQLPYRSERVPVSSGQLGGWRGVKVGTTVRLDGPCPACRHPTRVVASLTSTSLEGFEPATGLTVAFVCNCGKEHRGQPPEPPQGCGRSWSATATIGDDGTASLAPVDDPQLVEAAEAFRLAQTGQLDRLRSAAEKWIAGITALLGLLGVAGIGFGAEQVRKLGVPGRISLGTVIALAILSGAVAIALAYRAAYGWPRRRSVADDTELLAWHADQQALPAAVAGQLRNAVTVAGVALALLTVAAGLLWFLPEAKPAAPLVKVSTAEEAVICGTLLSSRADGSMRVRRADVGAVETVPLAGVARVVTVAKC